MRVSILSTCAVLLLVVDGKSLPCSPRSVSARTFDGLKPDQQREVQKIFRYLKIRRQSRVADIGAGSGWLTLHLSRIVGPKGQVYAEDIFPRQISAIEQQVKKYNLTNVQVISGSISDPKLPEKTLDAAIALNAYHEFKMPLTLLKKIAQAMKRGARLGIIDRDTDRMRTEAQREYATTGYISHRVNESLSDHYLTVDHYLAMDIVKHEATSVGFKFLYSRELDGDFYIAVFTAP